jgi:hypothetical protein
MTVLHRLYVEQGQGPWLDRLTRGYLTGPETFAGGGGVGLTLEDSGVGGFHDSFQTMIAGLAAKASQLSRR